MACITFEVAGSPAPQGSKCYKGHRGGRPILVEQSKKLEPWRAQVAHEAKIAMAGASPLGGPVAVGITFRFLRAKSHFGTGTHAGFLRSGAPMAHTQQPDLDKLVRGVLDAISEIVVADDRQVVRVFAAKQWATTQGADIWVREVKENEA